MARSFNSRWARINRQRKETGKRSGLEVQIAAQLDRLGVKYEYETRKIEFTKPAKPRKYTPDFVLANGIIIEAKGLFDTADRQKHLLVKEQHPHLDVRFVFSNPNQRISKQSKTTYGMWCEKYGFKYSKDVVPMEWFAEKDRCSHTTFEHKEERSYGTRYFWNQCTVCEWQKDNGSASDW